RRLVRARSRRDRCRSPATSWVRPSLRSPSLTERSEITVELLPLPTVPHFAPQTRFVPHFSPLPHLYAAQTGPTTRAVSPGTACRQPTQVAARYPRARQRDRSDYCAVMVGKPHGPVGGCGATGWSRVGGLRHRVAATGRRQQKSREGRTLMRSPLPALSGLWCRRLLLEAPPETVLHTGRGRLATRGLRLLCAPPGTGCGTAFRTRDDSRGRGGPHRDDTAREHHEEADQTEYRESARLEIECEAAHEER